MNDLQTMGIAGTLGYLFQHFAEITKAAHGRNIEAHELQEKSMEAAQKRWPGKVLRYGIYFIVAFSFIALMLAGFLDEKVVLEYKLNRNFLFFNWDVVKLKKVAGVVFVSENRSAFLAMISFLFGKGVR